MKEEKLGTYEAQVFTIREIIELLLDKGSFIELDKFVSHGSTKNHENNVKEFLDGIITGYGTVDGRLIFVYGQDSTLISGSMSEAHANKISRIQDMALKMGAPIIGINDSSGMRLEEGINPLSGLGKILYNNAISSGVIPQISIITGLCAGGAAYSPGISDFVFTIDKSSQMFINGPQITKSISNKDISSEELGGAKTLSEINGVADFISGSKEQSIEKVRTLLSYLPSNNLEESPIYELGDNINRVEGKLNQIIPNDSSEIYDMTEIVRAIADNGEFFEIKESYGKNIITGFIRLNGKAIGIVGNQPNESEGFLDIKGVNKAARFIRTCDAFNIPLLTLVDVPGFLPGIEEEYGGIIRHGAKLIYAYSEATVPKVTLIVGKAYGSAYIAMGGKDLGVDQVLAWPEAEIALMAPEGAASILFKDDIGKAEDPIITRREKIEKYRKDIANPYVAANKGLVDDIISPDITRPRLISAFDILDSKRDNRPRKKHGNLPV